MFTDVAEKIRFGVGVPKHVTDVMRVSGRDHNVSYPSATLFGQPAEEEDTPGAYDWSRCLRTLFTEGGLCNGVYLTGSGITLPTRESYSQDESPPLPLLNERLYPLLGRSHPTEQGLIGKKYDGTRPDDMLSPVAYGVRELLERLKGPNVDGNLITTRPLEDTRRKILQILPLALHYPYDGGPRFVAEIIKPGGFRYITMLEDGNRQTNFFVKSPDWQDDWEKMYSMRQNIQRGQLKWSPEGIAYIEYDPNFKDRIISMEHRPKSIGEWEHFVARALRTMVKHDIPGYKLNDQSFWWNQPLNNRKLFPDIVGTMANLADAFIVNPDKTMGLIHRLGLDRHLPLYNPKLVEALGKTLGNVKQAAGLPWSQDQRRLIEMIASPQDELFPPESTGTYPIPPDSFGSLGDFAPFIASFSTLKPDAFAKAIPPPGKRGQINPIPFRPSLGPTPENCKAVHNAFTALDELESEARTNGKLDLAEIIGEGSAFVRKQYALFLS